MAARRTSRAVALAAALALAAGACGDGADPASRREILTVAQPSIRHHGGGIVVGPDGLLWLGLGDGSLGGDPAGAAQSLATLRGKLLRRVQGRDLRVRPARPVAVLVRPRQRRAVDRRRGQNIVEEIDRVAPGRAAGASGRPLRHRDLGLRLPGLVSFAESHTGELYALSLAGDVHRLAPAS